MIHLIKAWQYDDDYIVYWDGGSVNTLGPWSDRETSHPNLATCPACLKKASEFGAIASNRLEELTK